MLSFAADHAEVAGHRASVYRGLRGHGVAGHDRVGPLVRGSDSHFSGGLTCLSTSISARSSSRIAIGWVCSVCAVAHSALRRRFSACSLLCLLVVRARSGRFAPSMNHRCPQRSHPGRARPCPPAERGRERPPVRACQPRGGTHGAGFVAGQPGGPARRPPAPRNSAALPAYVLTRTSDLLAATREKCARDKSGTGDAKA
jgi:hypothetical protein